MTETEENLNKLVKKLEVENQQLLNDREKEREEVLNAWQKDRSEIVRLAQENKFLTGELNLIDFIIGNRRAFDGLNNRTIKIRFMSFILQAKQGEIGYTDDLKEKFLKSLSKTENLYQKEYKEHYMAICMETEKSVDEENKLPYQKLEEKHKQNPDKEFHPIG